MENMYFDRNAEFVADLILGKFCETVKWTVSRCDGATGEIIDLPLQFSNREAAFESMRHAARAEGEQWEYASYTDDALLHPHYNVADLSIAVVIEDINTNKYAHIATYCLVQKVPSIFDGKYMITDFLMIDESKNERPGGIALSPFDPEDEDIVI